MSKVTNPETESSVTCGFFNSLNSDRKYDATQMSSIFDGIIKDGIFDSIGTCFVVNANTENIVNVGIGKAWFNHTWIENDAILPVECDESELLLDRIDAVVIEVDATETVRDCFIKVVNGTPSSEPENPELTDTTDVHQYALCYIYRTAGSTEITDSDITNMVGTDDTPFITGILETVSLDTLLGQWRAELDEFIASEESDFAEWYQAMIDELAAKASELDTWTDDEQASFLAWFEKMKDQLGEDAAGNLQNEIDKAEVERILMVGLTDGTKTFSDDGLVITTVDSTGRTLVKTFSSDFLTCESVLTDAEGGIMGSMTKIFASDGKTISTEVTII